MSRGRGRGRGRGRSLANLDALKLPPGEPPPPPILQPPPLFPQLERKPLELPRPEDSEVTKCLLRRKQEIRRYMQQSPFHLKAGSDRKSIHRYSDRYKEIKSSELDNVLEWTPDWRFFPDELQIKVKRRKRKLSGSQFKPHIPTKRAKMERKLEAEPQEPVVEAPIEAPLPATGTEISNKTKKVTFSLEDPNKLTERFEQLEKKEQVTEGENESGEEEGLEEELYDEELEEETDYIMSYFDNGEDYMADENDNLDEGPYY